MRLYGPKDVDKKALRKAKIAVLGYGSQGRAHALNLKDSGFDVVVGVRKGKSFKQAKKDGLNVTTPAEAVVGATLIAMLVPDIPQKQLYEEIESKLAKNAVLLFAHGFNIHFKQITPRKDLDVVLIAPKGPGGLVRRQFQQGRGVPALIAVHQDATKTGFARALAYAHGIGATRGGVLATTFGEETETDLFGEQAVLCGGTPNWCWPASRRWSKRAISPKCPKTKSSKNTSSTTISCTKSVWPSCISSSARPASSAI